MTAHDIGSFPPNTLYRLVDVIEAGKWVAPGGEVRAAKLNQFRAADARLILSSACAQLPAPHPVHPSPATYGRRFGPTSGCSW
eukprot:5805032-Prymnesium_polylepis.1